MNKRVFDKENHYSRTYLARALCNSVWRAGLQWLYTGPQWGV